ncbi:MAG: hypothetical protein NT157_05250 [Candidatus Micrarchaeota archaeon]|nr:hypothetical protein [Candidatus Micrarchaeota archaeon]
MAQRELNRNQNPSAFRDMAPIADSKEDLKSKPADSGTEARAVLDAATDRVVEGADRAIRNVLGKIPKKVK